MFQKDIICFGNKIKIACDGKCEKAWGISNRPKIILDENDEDDFAYLSDDELGIAPEDPGTYEGGFGKPEANEEKLNKWCYRECERCSKIEHGENIQSNLNDFSKRVYNIEKH